MMEAEDASAVTRRRLVGGACWSVPVVMAAAAAPAYAASACPELTVTGALTPTTNYDRITVSNSGTITWPLGTTITWTIENRASVSDTFAIVSRTGVVQSGASSITLASGATGTLTFTTTAAVAPAAFVRWVMSATNYTYYSTITVSFPGMSTWCTPKACISGTWNAGFGTTCAGAGAAVVAARSAPTATRGPRA